MKLGCRNDRANNDHAAHLPQTRLDSSKRLVAERRETQSASVGIAIDQSGPVDATRHGGYGLEDRGFEGANADAADSYARTSTDRRPGRRATSPVADRADAVVVAAVAARSAAIAEDADEDSVATVEDAAAGHSVGDAARALALADEGVVLLAATRALWATSGPLGLCERVSAFTQRRSHLSDA